jgi:hypothetical protein
VLDGAENGMGAGKLCYNEGFLLCFNELYVKRFADFVAKSSHIINSVA